MAGIAVHSQGSPEWVRTRDGRRLYAQVLPGVDTVPTVVFEGGAGATRSYWAAVQQQLGIRSVVYDRSGLGRSEPDPAELTIARSADDLVDLLRHFGSGPFILVGHSAGAPIVRLAASRRLCHVSGLVLVDPIDEDVAVLFSAQFRRRERVALRVGTVLARLGLLRFLFGSLLAAAPADDVRDDLRREAFTVGLLQTQARQARGYLDELDTWKPNPPDMGDIPVTVISGGLARPAEGMPRHVRDEAIAAHIRRAALSPRGRHVIAERSGHTVPLTEPQVIADEVVRLISDT